MSNDEFSKVELPAIDQLKKLNWKYVEGIKLSPDKSDERKSFKHVVLKQKLSQSIKKINPWYSSPLSLLCYKGNHKEITREICILTEKYY